MRSRARHVFRSFLALALSVSAASWADEPAPKTEATDQPPEAEIASRADAALDQLVDEMDQASLQEAFRILRSDYIKHETLSYLELNRAAMQGLLERLDFGAMLLTKASREAQDSPFSFHAEKLNPSIGYVRFGKFKKAEIDELDEALAEFGAGDEVRTLIVDLRSPQAMADFEIASSILSRFREVGEILFKIRHPREERPILFTSRDAPKRWNRDILVLIDRETGNVGEIIAAVLRQKKNCFVIGEKTVGMTVEYRDVPVGGDRILRYAVAEVVLPEGESLFQQGVIPDVRTPSSTKVKQAVFRASEKEPLAGFVFDHGRPRMNEAALVAGTDPELDYYVARSRGEQTSWDKPILRDRVLRQAVDLLTISRFLPSEEAE
ncbi:MAG: S41 family peptidase [Verrucomicrobiae bacterium]|nr:S41 family peptidase [Verrucomicrobiae bacterium]